jgi:putative redox protein
MTIRLHARHKKYPLSHVEVAVLYHHVSEGGRGSFERTITLQGSPDDDQRAQLLRGANMCPVGKTFGLSAEIHTTSDGGRPSMVANAPANYANDLEEFSVAYIDPD